MDGNNSKDVKMLSISLGGPMVLCVAFVDSCIGNTHPGMVVSVETCFDLGQECEMADEYLY